MIEGYLQRRTIRNLYLIREQTVSALGMTFRSMRSFDFKKWLEDSAPSLLSLVTAGNLHSDYDLSHEALDDALSEDYTMALHGSMGGNEKASARIDEEIGVYGHLMRQSSYARGNGADETHTYEMQIEWDVEDFILSGAIMHILCSLEELERGLLRILFLYGTERGVDSSSQKHIHPTLKDLSRSSPEWEEAENSKSLYSVSRRHAMLEAYSINAEPDTDWNARLWSMRTDRNTLARAVATLRYPFQSFLQVHYDAYRTVRHLAQEALLAQRIVL